MPRKRLGYGLCLAISIAGVGLTVAEYWLGSVAEDERVMERLSARVEWESRTIERGLGEGMMPLAALAALLASKPMPTREQFRAVAVSARKLGMPMGQLGWAPVVPGEQRAAFEAKWRAEIPGYGIKELDANRQSVAAGERPAYVPILYAAGRQGYPSNIGFDIASDAVRLRALDDARDLGAPVGLQPRLSSLQFGSQPIFAVYWPLYDGSVVPASVPERRRLLTGYVVSLIRVSDMLGYTMRNFVGLPGWISFVARNAGEPERVSASYSAGQGVVAGDLARTSREPGSVVLRRKFDALHHDWLLEFEIPASEIASMHRRVPLVGSGLLLLLTAALACAALERERRSERERAHSRMLEAAAAHQERTNKALLAANERLVVQEQAARSLALARTRLVAVASHDLRQPLAALTLFTSALRSRVNDPIGSELVGDIGELALSMQRMFTSLLDLSRLDSGAVKGKIRTYSAHEMAGRLTAEFAGQAARKGLTLRQAGRFPPVKTDPALLESILRNLICNAIKFTDRGGVLIAGRIRGAMSAIQIWDTGPGIPASELARVFREFERVQTNPGKPGFGLGLSIAKQFCREVGATCTVHSRPGRGSCFTVELPLAYRPERPKLR